MSVLQLAGGQTRWRGRLTGTSAGRMIQPETRAAAAVGVATGKAVRRTLGLLVMLVAILVVPPMARPAAAWHAWPHGRGAWIGPSWGLATVAPYPAALPYGSRFYYPPGSPLSYDEPSSGTTYCLSRPTGLYYVCGYSLTARETAEPAYWMPPPGALLLGEQRLPAPSGVLIFQLPQGAEAAVDGVPVGLSGGLGVTSVTPGQHRILVRAAGTETERTLAVNPHAIFTVTPTGIVPTAP